MEDLTEKLYCMEITPKKKGDPSSRYLKFRDPDLFEEIDKSRYDESYLEKITCGSNTKIWWVCPINPCGCHIYESTVSSRLKGTECAFCRKIRRQMCKHSKSMMSDPLLEKEFYYEHPNNQCVDPYSIMPGSNKKFYWKCSNHTSCNDHVWEATPNHRIGRKSGCPFCNGSGKGKKVCSCDTFLNNKKLAEEYNWSHPGNADIDPYKISEGSHVHVWWKCLEHTGCDMHEWFAAVCDRNGRGCPFCYGTGIGKKVCSCDTFMVNPLLEKEFYWCHPENEGIDPYRISSNSGIRVWWKCSKHKTCEHHIWDATVNHRNSTDGRGCPFCDGKKICSCRTFMNNPLFKHLQEEFDFEKNEGVDPYQLSSGSHIRLWWKCSTCSFSWESLLHNRTNDRGCPSCAATRTESKGERRCREFLEEMSLETYSQVKLHYLPTRRYDFVFEYEDNIYVIEYDGSSHFKYVPLWHETIEKFRELQRVDKIKTLIPLILGYNVLRISNDDPEHIQQCIVTFVQAKEEFPDKPIIAVDDYDKYQYVLTSNTKKLIRDFCDPKYHDEIIEKFKRLNVLIVDLKDNTTIEKRFLPYGT